MPDSADQQSPLVQYWKKAASSADVSDRGVVLTERAFVGHLNLRGNPKDPIFADGVRKATSLSLPVQPNTSVSSSCLVVLWLGPDEWMVLTPPGEESNVGLSLETALAGNWHTVTDVTSGYTIIGVHGTSVRDVLAKGCQADLDPRVFREGDCIQTNVAKTGVLLWRRDRDLFELIVRRSFADYAAQWIEDAALEFGFKKCRESAAFIVAPSL